MTCDKLELLLALYVEGDLSAPKARAIEEHLRACPSCHRFARGLTASQIALKNRRRDAAPEAALDRVRGRVMSSVARERPPRSSPDRRYAAAAGVIVAIAVAAISLRHTLNRPWEAIETARLAPVGSARPAPVPPARRLNAASAEFPRSRKFTASNDAGGRPMRSVPRGVSSAKPMLSESAEARERVSYLREKPPAFPVARRAYSLTRLALPNLDDAALLAFESSATDGQGEEAAQSCRPGRALVQSCAATIKVPLEPELKVKLVTDDPNVVIYLIVG